MQKNKRASCCVFNSAENVGMCLYLTPCSIEEKRTPKTFYATHKDELPEIVLDEENRTVFPSEEFKDHILALIQQQREATAKENIATYLQSDTFSSFLKCSSDCAHLVSVDQVVCAYTVVIYDRNCTFLHSVCCGVFIADSVSLSMKQK